MPEIWRNPRYSEKGPTKEEEVRTPYDEFIKEYAEDWERRHSKMSDKKTPYRIVVVYQNPPNPEEVKYENTILAKDDVSARQQAIGECAREHIELSLENLRAYCLPFV